MRLFTRLTLAVCLLGWAIGGCGIQLQQPDDEIQITCGADSDCTGGRVCVFTDAGNLCRPPSTSCIEQREGRFVSEPDGNGCALTGGEGICLLGSCQESLCGDGFADLSRGESCDDPLGNDDTLPDTCRSDCSLPHCGDNVRDSGEECDDDSNPLCLPGCLLNFCGDGTPAGVEECDDGNGETTDACLPNCKRATCGDGSLYASVEACEELEGSEAFLNPNDGCHACQFIQWNVLEPFVGVGPSGGDSERLSFRDLRDLQVDMFGNTYFSDFFGNTISRVDPVDARVARYAGTGAGAFRETVDLRYRQRSGVRQA